MWQLSRSGGPIGRQRRREHAERVVAFAGGLLAILAGLALVAWLVGFAVWSSP